MANVWVYQLDIIALPDPSGGIPDVSGFEAETSDGEKIGKVDQATEMAEKAWIVVDTGHWIFGKKRMIPAGLVTAIDEDQRLVRIALTKAEIKNAPDFDEVRRNEAFYQDTLENYYRKHLSPRS